MTVVDTKEKRTYGGRIAPFLPAGGSDARTAGLRGGSRSLTLGGRAFEVGGDVVVAVGRTPVRGSDDLVRIVTEALRPGQLVTFTVLRDAKRVRVPVRLGARSANSTD